MSVDNFICDVNRQTPAFAFVPEGEHIPDFLGQIKSYDAVLMGAQTYEFGYQYGMKPGEPGYKGIKHYVFSRSINVRSNSEVEFVKTDAVEFVKNLKGKSGKKLWLCGGGNLAGTMLDNGLLDELVIKVNPSLLGDGVRLFGNSKRQVKLELLDLKRYTSGVILSSYKIHY